MCGRYVIEDFEELSETLRQIPFVSDYEPRPNWNAAPTQELPVLVAEADAWHLRPMQWGLVPRWTQPGERPKVAPINARQETLAEKPMFRNLVRRQRCLVPANGFYEWRRTGGPKQPFYITLADGSALLMAGLYDRFTAADGETRFSYTIITGGPNERMAGLHNRMPVILRADDAVAWLDPAVEELAPLEHLLAPIASVAMTITPVSEAVNSVKNNRPELIAPIAQQEPLC